MLKRVGAFKALSQKLTLNRLLQTHVSLTDFDGCDVSLMNSYADHYLHEVLAPFHDLNMPDNTDDIENAKQQYAKLYDVGTKRTRAILMSLIRLGQVQEESWEGQEFAAKSGYLQAI